MKIVQVSDYFPDYGAHVVETIASKLASWGHDLLVLAGSADQDGHQYSPGWDLSQKELRIYRFRSFGIKAGGVCFSIPHASILRAVKVVREFRPNVANLHFIPHLGNVAMSPFLRMARIPILYTIHGVPVGYTSRTLKASSSIINQLATIPIQLSQQIIAVSDQVRTLAQRTYMIDRSKIKVIPNGIDVGKFRPVHGKFSGETIRIGFCGRLARPKRVDSVIRGLAELRDKFGTEVLGIIAGDGPARKELQELAKELSAPVEFLGHIEGQAIINFYDQIDALALLSQNEGLPQTVLEAMSCGVPVITSGAGGISDVISDRTNGMILQSGSSSELACAIYELIKDKALVDRISANSRQTILTAYSDDTMCKQYLRAYEEACGQPFNN